MPKNLKAFGGQAQYSWFMLDEGGSQFGVWSLEFGVYSLEFGVWSSGFMSFLLESTTVLAGLDRPPVL